MASKFTAEHRNVVLESLTGFSASDKLTLLGEVYDAVKAEIKAEEDARREAAARIWKEARGNVEVLLSSIRDDANAAIAYYNGAPEAVRKMLTAPPTESVTVAQSDFASCFPKGTDEGAQRNMLHAMGGSLGVSLVQGRTGKEGPRVRIAIVPPAAQ